MFWYIITKMNTCRKWKQVTQLLILSDESIGIVSINILSKSRSSRYTEKKGKKGTRNKFNYI